MCIRDSISTDDITYVDETMTDTLEIETYNQKIWTPGITPTEQWGYNIRLLRYACLLYTSDAADERSSVDLGGRRIIKKKKNKIN